MARNALSQAKENLKISNDQYQVGMENLTALLEAQAQWQETRASGSMRKPCYTWVYPNTWKRLESWTEDKFEDYLWKFWFDFSFEFIIFVLLIINFIKWKED